MDISQIIATIVIIIGISYALYKFAKMDDGVKNLK